jgi:serine/threonine-protein kinase RsbW
MADTVNSTQVGLDEKGNTLRLKAVLENVPVAIACVSRLAESAGFDNSALYAIQLAVDEACANVVQHAYEGSEPGDMEISCLLEDQTLTIRVRDWGWGFDPNGVEVPDIEAPLEERTLGGLGLFIVNNVMDFVKFTFDPELGNELTMSKRLEVAA